MQLYISKTKLGNLDPNDQISLSEKGMMNVHQNCTSYQLSSYHINPPPPLTHTSCQHMEL
jgi:hypothetical protein